MSTVPELIVLTVTSNPAVLLTAREFRLPGIEPDIFGTILAFVLVVAVVHELQVGFNLFIVVITHRLPPFSAHHFSLPVLHVRYGAAPPFLFAILRAVK